MSVQFRRSRKARLIVRVGMSAARRVLTVRRTTRSWNEYTNRESTTAGWTWRVRLRDRTTDADNPKSRFISLSSYPGILSTGSFARRRFRGALGAFALLGRALGAFCFDA